MMKTKTVVTTYTENEMGDAFEVRASSKKGLPGIGRFWRVFREVDSWRGRPDFVCLQKEGNEELPKSTEGLGLVGATILAALNRSTGQPLELIHQKTGYAESSVKQALVRLLVGGFIKKDRNDKYKLVPGRGLDDLETIAFELKLKNAKRALYQAQQYKCFADRVYVVVPPQLVDSFGKYQETMTIWGFGLASFVPIRKRFRVEVQSKGKRPETKHQAFYTIMNAISSDAR
jgi:hypothetical protein